MFCECHGHIIADGISYRESMARHISGVDETYVRKALEAIAASGVTFYRDGGDKYLVSAFARKIAGEYGIDYRTPVWILHKEGHYGSMYGRSFADMREFASLVREAKALGADFIKVTVTGMLDFARGGMITGPVFGGPELAEAVRIAHGEGFAVMAHANGAANMKAALEAGVDSVEHGFWPDESVIPCFLQSGAVWVPTCAAVCNLIGQGRYDDNVLEEIRRAQRDVLIKAYARGVLIASGSDCGAWKVGQGTGTIDECAILSSMGIDPGRGNIAIAERFKRR